jgi:hypothetical protein
VRAGDTFLVALVADEHLWMVISDPEIDPQRVLMVNFSSWKPYHDQACIVEPGEHPFVIRRSCVNYPEARLTTSEVLERLIAVNQLFPRQSLSAELLARIRRCARTSRLKLEHLQVLVDQSLIE